MLETEEEILILDEIVLQSKAYLCLLRLERGSLQVNPPRLTFGKVAGKHKICRLVPNMLLEVEIVEVTQKNILLLTGNPYQTVKSCVYSLNVLQWLQQICFQQSTPALNKSSSLIGHSNVFFCQKSRLIHKVRSSQPVRTPVADRL